VNGPDAPCCGEKTIFVLGAGFTRAFFPKSPLLLADYRGEQLLEEVKALRAATKILETELRISNGCLNLERLLTRLHSQMPYEPRVGELDEYRVLSNRLVEAFEKRLRSALRDEVHLNDLKAFAHLCAREEIDCITFNYDTALDQALHGVKCREGRKRATDEPESLAPWDPDTGYGFFCPASPTVLGDSPFADIYPTRMVLLKLHGSLNWRVTIGTQEPYRLGDIVHHDEWSRSDVKPWPKQARIESLLEKRPILVPPLPGKDALLVSPVLCTVWRRAWDLLTRAEEVVFVGYSLPLTDIASRYLFSEAISPTATVRVINFAKSHERRNRLVKDYKEVFPHLADDAFSFAGALHWARELVQQSQEHPS